MVDLKCPKCGRTLARQFEGQVEIKCHACKTVSSFNSNGQLMVKTMLLTNGVGLIN